MVKGPKKSTKDFKHKLELEYMRSCIIFGKKYAAAKAYFEANGLRLGESKFYELKSEVKSSKASQDWFAKEAIWVIEDDHKLSVERIRMLEDRLMAEFEQVSATNFYTYINEGTEEQQLIKDKSHDANLLLRIIAQFQALQETKNKMYSATPLVQEIMEIQKRHEQESELGYVTNKGITNTV